MSSPKRARLTINIGVTGHRDLALSENELTLLKSQVDLVLAEIQTFVKAIYKDPFCPFNNNPPVSRMISSLAEGSDRLVAKRALESGFELQCPLPFHCEEYEKDFITRESLQEFRNLLEQSSAVLELDENREPSRQGESYLSSGRVVLHQSDLIIAVWSGEEAKGKGGTGNIVEEAHSMGIPVLWIKSYAPFEITLIDVDEELTGWKEGIESYLISILNPFKKGIVPSFYFSEINPRNNWGFMYRMFKDLFASFRLSLPQLKLRNFLQSTEEDWQQDWNLSPNLPPEYINQANSSFRDHYAWSDKLAIYYSNLYRSAYLLKYFFITLAVISVAVGLYTNNWKALAFQIISMSITISFILYENRQGWHRRFLDYRLLAEMLRIMRFLMPFGHSIPSINFSIGKEFQSTWLKWHFRAVIREAGLMHLRLDHNFREAYRTFFLKSELYSQQVFHTNNSIACGNISRRLEKFSMFLFVLSLVFIVLRFVVFYYHDGSEPNWIREYSINIKEWCVILPIIGSSFAGIRSQGEFSRLAIRSQAMTGSLEHIIKKLLNLEVVTIKKLEQYADETAYIMVDDVSDWQGLVKAKSLTLPL